MNSRVLLTSLCCVLTTLTSAGTLKVNRSKTVTLSDAKANTILKNGSAALRIEGTTNKCGVSLSLDPPVTAAVAGTGSIDSQSDFDSACGTGAYIHIVKSITWCSGYVTIPNATIMGCSLTPGKCEMVVRVGDVTRQQSLWMHEYGHTKGLQHRTGPKLLMSPTIGPDQFEVSQRECDKMKGRRPHTQSEEKEDPKVSIERFVRRNYAEGIPFAAAKSYGPSDVPALTQMLHDSREQDVWPNVVFMLGVLGNTGTVDELIAFLEKPVDTDNPAVYRAKVGVLLALGYLVNQHQVKGALEYLEKATSVQNWLASNTKLPGENVSDSAIELARASILGLGVTGNVDALQFLQKLDPNIRKVFDAMVNRAIEVNQRVAAKGLE